MYPVLEWIHCPEAVDPPAKRFLLINVLVVEDCIDYSLHVNQFTVRRIGQIILLFVDAAVYVPVLYSFQILPGRKICCITYCPVIAEVKNVVGIYLRKIFRIYFCTPDILRDSGRCRKPQSVINQFSRATRTVDIICTRTHGVVLNDSKSVISRDRFELVCIFSSLCIIVR